MGAWGYANFENDTALDFVWEIEESGVSTIIHAIKKINTVAETEQLDADECTEALAAIEYIATAKGNMSEDFPESAEEWMAKYKGTELTDAGLVAESHKAIDRIKSNSALKELWAETEDGESWLKVLEGLKSRIS